jgi:hypothetical protein
MRQECKSGTVSLEGPQNERTENGLSGRKIGQLERHARRRTGRVSLVSILAAGLPLNDGLAEADETTTSSPVRGSVAAVAPRSGILGPFIPVNDDRGQTSRWVERDEGNECLAIPKPIGGGLPALPGDVHEIDGIGDEGRDETYAALNPVIAGARFVGLGETIHTSGG